MSDSQNDVQLIGTGVISGLHYYTVWGVPIHYDPNNDKIVKCHCRWHSIKIHNPEKECKIITRFKEYIAENYKDVQVVK